MSMPVNGVARGTHGLGPALHHGGASARHAQPVPRPPRLRGVALVILGTTFGEELSHRSELTRFPHRVIDTDSIVTRLGQPPGSILHLTAPFDLDRMIETPGHFTDLQECLFRQYTPIITPAGTGGAAADAGALATIRASELFKSLESLIKEALPVADLSHGDTTSQTRELRVIVTGFIASGTCSGFLFAVLLLLREICSHEHGVNLLIEVHTTLPPSTGDLDDRATYRQISQASATLLLGNVLQAGNSSKAIPLGKRRLRLPTPLVDAWYLHSHDSASGTVAVAELTRQAADAVLLSASRTSGIGLKLEQARPRYVKALQTITDLKFHQPHDYDKESSGALDTASCPAMFSAAGNGVAYKGSALLAVEAASADTVAWLHLAHEWTTIQDGGPRDPAALCVRIFGAAAGDPGQWAMQFRTRLVPELDDFDTGGQLLQTDQERQRVIRWYQDQHQACLARMREPWQRAFDELSTALSHAISTLSPIPSEALSQLESVSTFLGQLLAVAQSFSTPPQSRADAIREAAAALDAGGRRLDEVAAAARSFVSMVAEQFRRETRATWWALLRKAVQGWQPLAESRLCGFQRFARELELCRIRNILPEQIQRRRIREIERLVERCFFTDEECGELAASAPSLYVGGADGTPVGLSPSQAGSLLERLAEDGEAQAAASRGDAASYLARVFELRVQDHLGYFSSKSLVDLLYELYPNEETCRGVLTHRLGILRQRAMPPLVLSEAQLSATTHPLLTDTYLELPRSVVAAPILLETGREQLPEAVVVEGPADSDERIAVWIGWHGIPLPMLAVYGGAYSRALVRRLGDAAEAPVWFSPTAESLVLGSGLLSGCSAYDQIRAKGA